MGLVRTTDPTFEPITVAEAKLHLRIDGSEEDAYVASLVMTARELAETWTGRAFCTQTLRLTLDRFPEHGRPTPHSDACGRILLPRSKVQSVTSVAYVDSAGDTQTMSTSLYTTDLDSEPARIEPAYGTTWPTPREQLNAVTVVFVAGWASAAAVPETVKALIKLMIGHLYENREGVNVGNLVSEYPLAVQSLVGVLSTGEYR